MPLQLKTQFESLEEAQAYLSGTAQAEINRLARIEEVEKPALVAKRDELLEEAKSAKTRAAAAEARVTELETQAPAPGQSEADFARIRSELETNFNQQIEALKQEREQEKATAAAATLKADAIAELSKPEYRLHNPEHFLLLHGSKLVRDPDSRNLYIQGTGQSISQFVQDIEARPSEQHLFKPKGGSGAATQTGVTGATTPTENPFKTGNLTEQGRLLRQNPALFERMKAEAGK